MSIHIISFMLSLYLTRLINVVNVAKNPSHQREPYMHEILNIDGWAVNCKMNLMSLLNP